MRVYTTNRAYNWLVEIAIVPRAQLAEHGEPSSVQLRLGISLGQKLCIPDEFMSLRWNVLHKQWRYSRHQEHKYNIRVPRL